MKVLTTIFLLFTILVDSYSQRIPQFKFTSMGVEPITINLGTNHSAKQIYESAKGWVYWYYDRSYSSIVEDINEAKITFSWVKYKGAVVNRLGTWKQLDISYTIVVDISDKEYTLTIKDYKIWDSYDNCKLSRFKLNWFFKKDGTIKRSQKATLGLNEYVFNELSCSLYWFIRGQENRCEPW